MGTRGEQNGMGSVQQNVQQLDAGLAGNPENTAEIGPVNPA
jgi:hypothetical protein